MKQLGVERGLTAFGNLYIYSYKEAVERALENSDSYIEDPDAYDFKYLLGPDYSCKFFEEYMKYRAYKSYYNIKQTADKITLPQKSFQMYFNGYLIHQYNKHKSDRKWEVSGMNKTIKADVFMEYLCKQQNEKTICNLLDKIQGKEALKGIINKMGIENGLAALGYLLSYSPKDALGKGNRYNDVYFIDQQVPDFMCIRGLNEEKSLMDLLKDFARQKYYLVKTLIESRKTNSNSFESKHYFKKSNLDDVETENALSHKVLKGIIVSIISLKKIEVTILFKKKKTV